MKEIWTVITLKHTDQQVLLHKRISWNKIYYSFDSINWSTTKEDAFKIKTKLTLYKRDV